MAKYDYNVVVVGGGTAGLISAYVANLLGAKVALIEAGEMGGDCLNRGCVPSKSLIASARAAASIESASQFGVSAVTQSIDYEAIHARIHTIIADIAPVDSAERYRELGVDVIQEKAEWVDGHTLKVGERSITARRIVIATGSRPRALDVPGSELPHVYNSDTIWGMRSLPKTMTVIGGGPIGVELASAYAKLGVAVTVLVSGKTLLGMLTKEQSSIVADSMQAAGVNIVYSANTTQITGSAVITETASYVSEVVLVAIGRTPNTSWLRNTAVTLKENGTVAVDKTLRTAIKSVYACGDVTGGYQFTHVAAHEAGYAGSNAALDWLPIKRAPHYTAIPWSIYTSPEVAHVGKLVSEAMPDEEVTMVPLNDVDRAKTDGTTDGGIWLVTNKNGTVLGATIIANHASSLIGEATLAVTKKLSMNDIFATIHPYPSYGDMYDKIASKWKQTHTNQVSLGTLRAIVRKMR